MTEKSKRNILFITADQWRGECLSALGHPCVKTPNIDALIADSVLFRNHYSVCAPCGPARASLLTGMYAQNHRSVRNGTPLDARHTNIALESRKIGYDPVLFGYTDISLDPRDTEEETLLTHGYEGVLPGFRAEVLLNESDPKPWIEHLRAHGYGIPDNPLDMFKPRAGYKGADEKGRTHSPPKFSEEHSQTAFLTDRVIGYLDGCDDGWFVHLSYLRPHPPFIAPEPYNSMYDADRVPMPVRADSVEDQKRQHPWLEYALEHPHEWEEPWMREEIGSKTYDRDVRQVRATYYGLISKIDANIGRLIKHLKASGAYDNTLIILTSDHGEMLGDRYLFGKRGYFDESYHIPLIIRAPGPEAGRGRILDQYTESVDVMPSILDWLDMDVPRQCDGRSVMGFVQGEPPRDWRRDVHWEYDFRDVEHATPEEVLGLSFDQCSMAVLRDRDFKYVHFAALPPLMFDLRKDPAERNNIIGDSAHTDKVLEYAQKMLSWRMSNDERVLTGYKISKRGIFQRRA